MVGTSLLVSIFSGVAWRGAAGPGIAWWGWARQGWAQYPLQVNLTLFWPGPLFPLSLLVLSLVYWRTKAVPLWVAGLLAVGAVAFPLSRIVRIEWVAHLVDLALLIPACYVAWRLFTRKPVMAQA